MANSKEEIEYGIKLIRHYGSNETIWCGSERQRDLQYLAHTGIKNIKSMKKVQRKKK